MVHIVLTSIEGESMEILGTGNMVDLFGRRLVGTCVPRAVGTDPQGKCKYGVPASVFLHTTTQKPTG